MALYKKGVEGMMSRLTGNEDYKFGDFRRSIFSRAQRGDDEDSCRSWIEVYSMSSSSDAVGENNVETEDQIEGDEVESWVVLGKDEESDDDEVEEGAVTCASCGAENRPSAVYCRICKDDLGLADGDYLCELSENAQERLEGAQAERKGDEQVDVVVVGAGPVGLWTAISLKLQRPDTRIAVLEKHSQYARAHVLKLKRKSFAGAPARLLAVAKRWPATVRTNRIEADLLQLARELPGISVEMGCHVTDVRRLLASRFRRATVLVGADGSHSVVRRAICGIGDGKARQPATMSQAGVSLLAEHQVSESLQCVMDVKYEAEGAVGRLAFVSQIWPTLKLMDHVGQEHVGRTHNGRTPVTVRLLISRAEFDALRGAAFKAPWYLYERTLPLKLHRSLAIWLNARRKLLGEVRVPASERATVINLSVYHARLLHQSIALGSDDENDNGDNDNNMEHDRSRCDVFLVGDAAAGVPFFRALNMGLQCGSMLASCLSKMSSETGPIKSAVEYTESANRLIRREISLARAKKNFLWLSKLATAVSGKVPWQTNFWGRKMRRLLTRGNPDFCGPNGERRAVCRVCGEMFRPDDSNSGGQCAHSGTIEPYSASGDGTVLTGYSCCGGASIRCPVSGPHERAFLFGLRLRDQLAQVPPPAIKEAFAVLRRAPDTVGLFRVSSDQAVLRRCLLELDSGTRSVLLRSDFDVDDEQFVHLNAGLLKHWLRQLPESLVSYSWLMCAGKVGGIESGGVDESGGVGDDENDDDGDHDDHDEYFHYSEHHRLIFNDLLSLCQSIVSKRAKSKMGPKALAICLAPALLGKQGADDFLLIEAASSTFEKLLLNK